LDVLEAKHYYWFILCSDSREEEEGVEGEEDGLHCERVSKGVRE
jgi:hypothetical protein